MSDKTIVRPVELLRGMVTKLMLTKLRIHDCSISGYTNNDSVTYYVMLLFHYSMLL